MNKPISQSGVQNPHLNTGMPNGYDVISKPVAVTVPLNLSFSQLTTRFWKLSDEVEHLKREGFDAIGLYRPKVFEYGDQRAADLIHRAKLNVSSLSFAGGFTGSCGFSYKEAVEDGLLAIEQARILAAKNLIIVGGARMMHTVNHSRKTVISGIKKLADRAACNRIQLCLLPMHRFFDGNWTFLNTLDAALQIIADIDHPSVRLALDTYHLQDEVRLVERIPKIMAMTGIVQLSDSCRSPEFDNDRLMPGFGKLPLKKIVRAFQTAGYTGYFDIQVWSSKVWKSNYSHLLEQSYAEMKSMALPVDDVSLECSQASR